MIPSLEHLPQFEDTRKNLSQARRFTRILRSGIGRSDEFIHMMKNYSSHKPTSLPSESDRCQGPLGPARLLHGPRMGEGPRRVFSSN